MASGEDAHIAGGRLAGVLLTDDAHPIAVASEELGGLIRRPIIDYEHL